MKVIIILISILLYFNYNNNNFYNQTYSENSLCYSFIPYNRYVTRNKICNINCSYIRRKSFPVNSPLKCKNKNRNISKVNYIVYAFNTSTYGIYINDFRFFYRNRVEERLKYEIIYAESSSFNFLNLYFIPTQLNMQNIKLSVAFNQQFKKTQNYLLSLSKDYYIYDMFKYHAIGLNSKPNYVPLFYGKSSKYRKSKNKSLFNIFHNNGYKTISLSGYCDTNMNYCGNPEVYGADHNINIACHPSVNNYLSFGSYGTGPRCVHGKRLSYLYLDYLQEAQTHYIKHNQSTFSFISFSETHDLSVAGIDSKLKQYLEKLNNTNTLQNIITFIVGDHGIHFGRFYNRFENTFPPLVILINKKRIKKVHHLNLRNNQNKLSTPYDLHNTLKYIAKGFRGSSIGTLFSEIPSQRSCLHAQIEYKCNCI